jgi:hypothetical protein
LAALSLFWTVSGVVPLGVADFQTLSGPRGSAALPGSVDAAVQVFEAGKNSQFRREASVRSVLAETREEFDGRTGTDWTVDRNCKGANRNQYTVRRKSDSDDIELSPQIPIRNKEAMLPIVRGDFKSSKRWANLQIGHMEKLD